MTPTESPLCVLHLLDHSLPVHSGYSFRSHEIFRAQRDRGWRPVVLTFPEHEESRRGAWSAKEQIDGVTYYRSRKLPLGRSGALRSAKVLARTAARLREVIAREAPDVIHAHSPSLDAIPALWVGKRLKIPVVYEIRAFWEDAAVDHGTYRQNSWRYRLSRLLETNVCRRADEVIVICRGLRDELVGRGIPSGRISIARNGVDVGEFQPMPPDPEYRSEWKLDGKRVIGFIGSFYHYEGVDLLVDAFARLSSTRTDLALLLVGGGRMESRLSDQIARLGLEDRVMMPGRIAHERMRSVYSVIDVLAYPRYSMRLTELVTPLKPLEAMAMGKAVVASDVGGHRELIRDKETGIFFPAGDAAALARAIGLLLDDDELRRSIERQGPTVAREEFQWSTTTECHSAIYARVTRGPAAR
jgi:PEP-CTERM/exosortase A-associated glycosyltransferase